MTEYGHCSGAVRALDAPLGARLDGDMIEPAWFYDLQAAVRELLGDNGEYLRAGSV